MKAIWNGKIIADSEETIEIEGNHYFPEDSLSREFFVDSDHTSFCPWKGTANYYSLKVDGGVNENAAWYYAEPKEAGSQIKDHVAFWRGVTVSE